MNNRFKATVLAAALAIPMATIPTSAQRPIVIGGGSLVNVQIASVDVIDDVTVNVEDIYVTVGAAVQVAANVCGVAVGVIAEDLADGSATCQSAQDADGIVDFVSITR